MPDQRIALVTGAGRGIGRAVAEQLAASHARVAVAARSAGELEETARAIHALGGEALVVTADLSQRDAAAHVVDEIEGAWGPVEILVNNAGVGSSSSPRPIVEFDDEFWDFTLRLNVTAPYLLTKRVLPAMIAARWGRIINVSSINATVPAMHASAYVASKHALAGLTKATAMEVAAHGVTCNAICPGVTATQMNDRRIEYDAGRLGKSAAEIEAAASPLGRRLLPDEVAPLAAFLASDAAAAINGQLINVCGGTVMR
jgi:NAD(P)-dependent dehydrogenase (short-subunit alcohol dehydrogenase family)